MKKIFVTDVDGTLTSFGASGINAETIESVNRLIENDFTFIVASGRPLRNIITFLKANGLLEKTSYIIALNGAVVYNNRKKEVLFEGFFTDEEALEIYDYLKPYDRAICVSYQNYCYADVINEYVNFEATGTNATLVKYENMKELIKIAKIPKIFMAAEYEVVMKVLEDSKEIFDSQYEHFMSGEIYYEFLPNGCSKGGGIKKIKTDLAEETFVYAIGDHYNDIDMFVESDISFSMGQAPEFVRKSADYITSDVSDSGFKKAVDKIIGSL